MKAIKVCSQCGLDKTYTRRRYYCRPCIAKAAANRRWIDGDNLPRVISKTIGKIHSLFLKVTRSLRYIKKGPRLMIYKIRNFFRRSIRSVSRLGFINRGRMSIEERLRKSRAACLKWRLRNPKYTTIAARMNPLKWRAYWHKRQELQKATDDGSINGESLNNLLLLQGGKCAECHVDLTTNKSHIDHIMPLSKGGPHIIGNIQILCRSCNLSKGNRIINK